MKKSKKLLIWLSIIIVVIITIVIIQNVTKTSNISNSMLEGKVTRGNLMVGVAGEGTLEPYERYEITSLVAGEILYAPYQEGDKVKKEDILYKIDSVSAEANVNVSRNSLESARINNQTTAENVNNLKIKATKDGYLTGFSLEVGDNVIPNTLVGIITNTEKLTVRVSFSENQIKNIYLGQIANVVLADYMSTIEGTITYISNEGRIIGTGTTIYDVEVTLSNPGAIVNGTKASVTITTIEGQIERSITDGTIKNENKSVIAKAGGEVIAVYAKNEQKVREGETIALLKNDDYEKAHRQSILSVNSMTQSLKSSEDILKNYTIKSPITGTIITKNNKAGDKVGDKMVATPLMVVADMEKMKFKMEIDELDIIPIKLEQEVKITADALSNETFTGKVTKISTEGKTVNGVTTYIAEIEIEEYGNLRTGMNVDADIIIEQLDNVLMIPMASVTELQGNTYAYVKDDGKKPSEDVVYNKEVPAGFRLQKIEVGESNNDYIEVKSGLNENDIVYSMITTNSDFMNKMMNEMMGFMQ